MSVQNKNFQELQSLQRERNVNVDGTFPLILQIEPTNACNARCPLCPTGTQSLKRKTRMLDMKLYFQVIDEACKFMPDLVMWNYGEPFIHANIYEMITYATSKGFDMRVSTNGFSFEKGHDVALLTQSGLTTLIVSIDGIKQETHSRYRNGTHLSKIIDGLRLLNMHKEATNNSKPDVIIQTLAFSFNENEIQEMFALAQEVGAKYQVKSANLDMVELPQNQKQEFLPTNSALPIRYNADCETIELKDRYQNYCPKLWEELVINSDGTVVPCCYDYHGDVVLGNLYEETIQQIWTGEKMRNFRSKVLSEQSKISICSTCSVAIKKVDYKRKYNT